MVNVTVATQPSIALVSQQARDEVLPIFYGQHTFTTYGRILPDLDLGNAPLLGLALPTWVKFDFKQARAWSHRIGRRNCGLIKSFHIRLSGDNVDILKRWVVEELRPETFGLDVSAIRVFRDVGRISSCEVD
jgi:hypothetical protein